MKRDNDFAVAGIALAIVPPLGLIFSIIGLTRAKARGGAGKTLSIAGIVMSLVVVAGTGTLVAIAGPAAPDPGCITAQAVPSQMMNTINADEAAMNRDQNNPLAMRADARHFMIDVQPLETRFTTAEAQAQHPSVKAALSALVSDLKTTTSGSLAMMNGDARHFLQTFIAAGRLESDGNALQSACTAVNGAS